MDRGSWRDRIKSNKPELCDLTSLLPRFLDTCVARNVLTNDEKNDIARRHDYEMKSRFYDAILTKDEKRYETMIDIMKKTDTLQSDDVINILTGQLDRVLQTQPGSSRQTVSSELSSMNLFSPTRRPVCFDLVQPLVNVKGRDDTLEDLHKLVTRNAGNEKNVPITSQLTCIWGLGGVGKTTLARKYAWDNCDYFDGNVIWIKADDEQSIQNSFEKLASFTQIKTQLEDWNKSREANMTKIFEFFSDRKSLFVFDNVEKYGREVDKFLPLSLGPNINKPYFLMTSRKEGLDQKIEDFKLGVPSSEDMAELMTTELKLQTDEDAATVHIIAVQLQGLPLAVQQAISYIHNLEKRKQRFDRKLNPIQEYLTLLQDNWTIQSILDFETADDYGKTVFRTWTTTIKSIYKYETYGRSAERIMHILAYFNHDSINCNILEPVYSAETAEKSLTLLAEYSMLELNEGFISIHPLVQQVIRIQNKSIEPELLKECLKILTKRSDTLEHSHTVWKSALNYNDLVIKYPRVGIRLCENVHFGSNEYTNSTRIFQDTSKKFNEVFGKNGTLTLELDCIEIISLCHDMSEPVYSLILQLNDDLIRRLFNCSSRSIYKILPTLYRLAGSLLQLGNSSSCPRKKRHEIITQSLKHYVRIQKEEKIKFDSGVSASLGESRIIECYQILSDISEIRHRELMELHLGLVSKDSEPKSALNLIGPSGVGKTTLVLNYVRNYADYYDGVIWINADTKESMELSILKISGEFDGTDLSSAQTHGSRSSEELQLVLRLLNLINKVGRKKYLFVFRRSRTSSQKKKVDIGPYSPAEFEENQLSDLFRVFHGKDLHVLVISAEILHYFRSIDSNVLHLDVFRRDEAIKQIRDYIPLIDNKLAGLLADKLHCFPLALHYATEYIMTDANSVACNCDLAVNGYLELFAKYSDEMQDKLRSSDIFEDTLEVVWSITKRKIEQENHGQEAIKMMQIISYLDPDDFSVDLVHSIDPECNTIECMKILEKHGLLTNWNSGVNIHPLLQRIIRKQNKSNKASTILQILLNANFECYGKSQLIFLWNRSTSRMEEFHSLENSEKQILREMIPRISRVFGPTHKFTINTIKLRKLLGL